MTPALSVNEADQRLRYWFDGCPAAAVALSGGVDSSLLAWYARDCLGPERMRACIADSPSLKRQDLDEAKQFCKYYDIPFDILLTQEIHNPDYASNPSNRCYFCKSTLYDDMLHTIGDTLTWACSGTNADDASDYRPGMQAAAEHQIRQPLLECGLDKATIRALANHHSLACWDKPASPCLSSRIPYGQDVSLEKLHRIEAAEVLLHKSGFDIVRVRHDHTTARIEVPQNRIHELQQQYAQLTSALQDIGFLQVEIDPEGFVSGKLNRSITT